MTRRKPAQATLDVRQYLVRCAGFECCTINASSAAGAKYRAFKLIREAGYFKGGFRAFLAHGVTVQSDRRPLRFNETNPELGL